MARRGGTLDPTHHTAVDGYLDPFPPAIRGRLDQIRATIRAAAPAATERMAYGIPTYHQGKNLVHFAGYVHHVGFYPGAQAMVVFAAELSAYKHAKGSVQSPHDRALPLDLVRRITEHRVAAETAAR